MLQGFIDVIVIVRCITCRLHIVYSFFFSGNILIFMGMQTLKFVSNVFLFFLYDFQMMRPELEQLKQEMQNVRLNSYFVMFTLNFCSQTIQIISSLIFCSSCLRVDFKLYFAVHGSTISSGGSKANECVIPEVCIMNDDIFLAERSLIFLIHFSLPCFSSFKYYVLKNSFSFYTIQNIAL